MHNEVKELRAEIKAVHDVAIVNSAKIDAYRENTGFGLTAITIGVAIVGIIAAVAPLFHAIYKELRQNKIQDMINASVSKAVDEAMAKAMSTMGK